MPITTFLEKLWSDIRFNRNYILPNRKEAGREQGLSRKWLSPWRYCGCTPPPSPPLQTYHAATFPNTVSQLYFHYLLRILTAVLPLLAGKKLYHSRDEGLSSKPIGPTASEQLKEISNLLTTHSTPTKPTMIFPFLLVFLRSKLEVQISMSSLAYRYAIFLCSWDVEI